MIFLINSGISFLNSRFRKINLPVFAEKRLKKALNLLRICRKKMDKSRPNADWKGDSKNYVAKRYKDEDGLDRQTYFDDIQMQVLLRIFLQSKMGYFQEFIQFFRWTPSCGARSTTVTTRQRKLTFSWKPSMSSHRGPGPHSSMSNTLLKEITSNTIQTRVWSF